MKTTYKQNSKTDNNPKKRKFFREVMGGEFLLSKTMIKWYPYLLLLFILAGITVINERTITSKEKKIKKLDEEYKKTISDLRNNNQFIPYDTNQKLIKMMELQGFVSDDKKIYKIPVKKTEEKETEN